MRGWWQGDYLCTHDIHCTPLPESEEESLPPFFQEGSFFGKDALVVEEIISVLCMGYAFGRKSIVSQF